MTTRHALRPGPNDQPWLIAVAAPAEARAIASALSDTDHTEHLQRAQHVPWSPIPLDHRLHLLVTGVGKANAAGAVAHTYDPAQHAGILSLGVAGALPDSDLSTTDIVLATRCVYADEGLITDNAFTDLAKMGFPPHPSLPGIAIDTDLDAIDASVLPPHTAAPVATVSTCSGTDAHAHAIQQRTGAACEAMEGAAVAFTAKRLAPARPVLELRVISNYTGDREHQRWDLEGALNTLASLARTI